MRVKTPTVLQMEALECGAASLGIILAYYGKYIPLEELRVACGVSRDGSSALKILKAARLYQMEAKGLRRSSIQSLNKLTAPFIVFWQFNHFIVFEGMNDDTVFINDPGTGPRTISMDEFSAGFTGVILSIQPTSEFAPSGERFNIIKSLWHQLGNTRSGIIYVLLASFLLILPFLLTPVFLRIFVDEILINNQISWLGGLIVTMGIALALIAGLTAVQQHYLLRLEMQLALAGSGRFLWNLLRLPAQFFSQRYIGDIVARVQLNDRVAQLLSGELATTLIEIILIIFYALLMFHFNALLTVVTVLIAGLNILALRYVSRKRVDTNFRLLLERGKLHGATFNGLETIETMKATGAETDFFARWAGYQANVINAGQGLDLLTMVLAIIPPLLMTLSNAIILLVGGIQVMNGFMTIGVLAAFQGLALRFMNPINQLVTLGSRLQEASGDMKRIDDILQHPIDKPFQRVIETTAGTNKLEGFLELRDLSFGYSQSDEPLIENFNLKMQPGQRIALVGGSGSGKSTVAKLVAGLYQPWSGDILLDNQSVTEIPQHIIHASVSMVSQEIVLFSGTIRENLSLWDSTIPKSQIIQAAKDAHIHHVIAARPGSYDFLLEENGLNFSGGERQRLEIARALVGNPSILILDEATSSLDPLTEQLIDTNLRRRGCTCLIVAHRLSTIRDADEIIVMEHGKIVQRGTHKQMAHIDGPYARLIGSDLQQGNQSEISSLLDELM